MCRSDSSDQNRTDEVKQRLDIARMTADLGFPIDDQLHDIAEAAGFDLSNNANPYVPWDDPQIPYHCECGQIIYADSRHSHGEDDE